MAFVTADGLSLPKMFETNRPMSEHLECLKAVDMREDDVILLAFPKCGTHWLWEVASMLLSGKREYMDHAKEFSMIEATEIEKIQSLPSPRILNTHLPLRSLPKQFREKKVKIIHVYRNPKDVAVSAYYHMLQLPHFQGITLNKMINEHFNTESDQRYVPYLRSLDTFVKDEPDHPVFNVSFEDTKEDPLKVITKLAEFLGVKASSELCAEIAEATEFSKMKKADSDKKWPDHLLQAQMYRKGEVGDWKNHLTVADSEIIDTMVEKLEGCNYNFRFTL